LVHFFEHGRWDSHMEMGREGQGLTPEDHLLILIQAGQYLTATRGLGASEAHICYQSAESLCPPNHPRLLCFALKGQWLYTLMTDKQSAALQIAQRIHSLAQAQDDPTMMTEAYDALAAPLYFLGNFELARQNAMSVVQIWRSGRVQSHAEYFGTPVATPVVGSLCYQALSEWHLGEIASCQANLNEAISLAKEINATHGLALALNWTAILATNERNPAEVDRLASDLIELSMRHNFVYWLALGAIHRGWARSVSGDTVEGITWIEQGIKDLRATGSVLGLPFYLAQKAEALHLADRTSEALEAINEAEALAERFEQRWRSAELHRLRGGFLAAMGADEMQIEASFRAAIITAKEQKSISLEKRAEATYAEYRRRKASGSGGRGSQQL